MAGFTLVSVSENEVNAVNTDRK